jgi:hypothetical protein
MNIKILLLMKKAVQSLLTKTAKTPKEKFDELRRQCPDPRKMTGVQSGRFARCLRSIDKNELSKDDICYIEDYLKDYLEKHIEEYVRASREEEEEDVIDLEKKTGSILQSVCHDWKSVVKLVADIPDINKKIAIIREAILAWKTVRAFAGDNRWLNRWLKPRAKETIPKLEAMLSYLEEEKAIIASLADNPATDNPVTSNVYLSGEKGMKINYIRVINCLYELGFFKDDKENSITKKDVFSVFGIVVNRDLSDYDKDLSRSLSDSTKLDKHLEIFDLMKMKMTEIFNAK